MYRTLPLLLAWSVAHAAQTLMLPQAHHPCTWTYSEGSEQLSVKCSRNFTRWQLREVFEKYPQSKCLSFTQSYLSHVPQDLCILASLRTLVLSDNNIFTINISLSCLKSLEEIHIERNKLTAIKNTTFAWLTNLKVLNLKNNSISYMHPKALWGNGLVLLKNIDLSYNNLKSFDVSNGLRLEYLANTTGKDHQRDVVLLNVSKNYISNLVNECNFDIKMVKYGEKLKVDLRGNQFKHIAAMDPVKLFNISNPLDMMPMWDMGFDFHHNPWDCDCDAYRLLSFFNVFIAIFKKKWHDMYYIEVKCETPPAAKGRLFYELANDVFRCDIKLHCPEHCTCLRTPGNRTISVFCRETQHPSFPNKLPFMEDYVLGIYMSRNKLIQVEHRSYFEYTKVLDLSFNNLATDGLSKETVRSWSNLLILLLNNNHLHYLPLTLREVSFKNLTQVSLHNNPYYCDCHSLWLKHWLLNNSHIVLEPRNIRCQFPVHLRGQPVMSVANWEFVCGEYETSVVFFPSVLYSSASVMYILMLLLLVFRVNRRQILMRHLRNYRGRPLFKLRPKGWSDPVSRGTVYLGYHPDLDEQARNMIDRVQQQLESQNFSVFDSQKEMLLGEPELKAMQDGLLGKETIVLFVDIKYLLDIHSTLEFRMAFDLWWANLDKHLILVCIEEKEIMLQHKRMDSDILCFMNMFSDSCVWDNFDTSLIELLNQLYAQVT